MPIIDQDIKYDFSDVLLKPKRSELNSRHDVDVEREFTFKHSKIVWKGVPIIVANMDTTGTVAMARALQKHKMITCLHKFHKADDIPDDLDPNYYAVSTGIGDKDLENLFDIVKKKNPIFICIDVANGYAAKFLESIKKIRELYPDKVLIGGNVATGEMVLELIMNGKLDIVKVGIGSGSCFAGNTRILMANGEYKNIKDIKVGDKVINMYGKPVSVINVIEQGKKEVIKVFTDNWHSYTHVTPDHKYWTYHDSKYQWSKIGSIDPIQNYTTRPYKVDFDIPNNFMIDNVVSCYELGYILGVFFKYDNKCVITSPDNSKIQKIQKYMLKLFNYECHIENNHGSITFYCRDENLVNLFADFANNPSKYYCKNDEYIKGLIDGITFFDDDPKNFVKEEILNWCTMNVDDKFEKYKYNRILGREYTGEIVETYDIEVDCSTHSFIANGSLVHNCCTTRLQTGVGVPQFSAILECANEAHGVNGHIISDGGIQHVADFSKAFGAGADFVMCGSKFAGHDECNSDVIEENGKKYSIFYGMSSSVAMHKYHGGVAHYRSAEGKCVKVPYKGSVDATVLDILGGIRSTMTYIGASKIKHIPKCAHFQIVNNQVNRIYSNKENEVN